MAVDTGVSDLLLDESAFRRLRVQPVGGETTTLWMGTPVAVRCALVQRLEFGGVRAAASALPCCNST